MSAGLFSKALKSAGFSVTTSRDGGRSFRDEHDDRTSEPSRGGPKYSRGYKRGGRDNWRGSSRGRRGSRSRGRSRGRGGGGRWYQSGDSQSEENDFGIGDEDGDIDMESGTERSQKRFTPYARPSHRQSDNKLNSRTTSNYPGETWNKITIPNGRKHGKEWLLNRLQKTCEVSFQPVEFHYSQDNACFFVNEKRCADALRSLSGQITVRDGSRLFINVRQCPPPKITKFDQTDGGDSVNHEVLKQSLDTRYDTSTNSLDLSNFYHDKVLNENQVQSALNRPGLLGTIVQLIKEYCGQLQNLDLRKNRISNLDALKDLHEAAPGISTLHLGENNLRHINELKKIKNLKELKSLVVDGNPLCDNYSNSQTGYVSDIRSIFPKLVSLDNCELPPHIGFDLPSSSNLPEIKGSFIPDEVTKKLVVPFVKQQYFIVSFSTYWTDVKKPLQTNTVYQASSVTPNLIHAAVMYLAVYDSDDRQKLLDAYDDEAVFSMCVVDFKKDRGNTPSLLQVYRKYSRNLKYLNDTDRRLELLKSSRLSVVAFLNDLPSTKHDLESLTVDVNFVQPTCMGFTVCGVFKEGTSEELRAFTRAFIAVPARSNSIAIVNDQLTIRNSSPGQQQNARKSLGFGTSVASPSLFPVSATPVSSPNPLATLSSQTTPNPQATASSLTMQSSLAGLNSQQKEMVTQFASQSGMNIEWSYKALSENNWDYQKAAEVFQTLHAQGKIPQEAFVK